MFDANTIRSAIEKQKQMDLKEQEKFMDGVYVKQPNLLGSVLVLRNFGLDMNDIGTVLSILMVLLLTLEESGVEIEQISEEQQDKELNTLRESINFSEGLSEGMKNQSIKQYVSGHEEKAMFSYVVGTLDDAGITARTDEKVKYLMMSALNLVNCISNAKRIA
jgi:hypothetical protein